MYEPVYLMEREVCMSECLYVHACIRMRGITQHCPSCVFSLSLVISLLTPPPHCFSVFLFYSLPFIFLTFFKYVYLRCVAMHVQVMHYATICT